MIAAIRKSLSLLSMKQRTVYFVLVGARAFSSVLDIAGIALVGLVTGLAASNLDSSQPLSILGFELPKVSEESLLILMLVILLIFIFKAVIAVWLARATAVFLARIESQKASEIAAYLLSGDLSYLQKFDKGQIVWASMGSVSIAFSGLLTALAIFISEGTLLVLVSATFFIVDPIAGLFVLIYFGIIVGLIQLGIGRALKKAGVDASEGNAESVLVLDDTIGAYREIAVLNKQKFFVEKFRQGRFRLASSLGTMNFLNSMPRYIVETGLILGVVLFVGFQFLSGQLASGLVTVGVFLTGGVRIMASLLPIQNALANAKSQSEQARLAQELLNDAHADEASGRNADQQIKVASPRPAETTKTALDVHMNQVSFTYPGAESPALRNVTLEIKSGQSAAFIGRSGAGKTTIVDLILGLMEPTSGVLSVGGEVSNHHSLIENGLVSYVPQKPGIVSGTIAENVALGTNRGDIDSERVLDALRAAHLEEFVAGLPDGIFTSVGNQSDALSGGQIQRLGLARALYSKPKLLVLDEATSALDSISEAYISETLQNLGDDVTVIVIAHRLSTVQHADIVFLVEDGSIAASGSFAHLRKSVPMVAEFVKKMSFESLPN